MRRAWPSAFLAASRAGSPGFPRLLGSFGVCVGIGAREPGAGPAPILRAPGGGTDRAIPRRPRRRSGSFGILASLAHARSEGDPLGLGRAGQRSVNHGALSSCSAGPCDRGNPCPGRPKRAGAAAGRATGLGQGGIFGDGGLGRCGGIAGTAAGREAAAGSGGGGGSGGGEHGVPSAGASVTAERPRLRCGCTPSARRLPCRPDPRDRPWRSLQPICRQFPADFRPIRVRLVTNS